MQSLAGSRPSVSSNIRSLSSMSSSSTSSESGKCVKPSKEQNHGCWNHAFPKSGHKKPPSAQKQTESVSARLTGIERDAEQQALLRDFIKSRCVLFHHCCEEDFDKSALDALLRLPLIQSLQTVEHYSSSVSPRIKRKSAYLMGILNGQQNNWVNFFQDADTSMEAVSRDLVLHIAKCCLTGNCLPSDFTPDVLLNLTKLKRDTGLKAVTSFNQNKRIAAGQKGGIVNRARFFLRLIQNISDQVPQKGRRVEGQELDLTQLADIDYREQQKIQDLEKQIALLQEKLYETELECEQLRNKLKQSDEQRDKDTNSFVLPDHFLDLTLPS